MSTTIRVHEEIKKQLKLKSAETGISQYDLANEYILEGLKKDKWRKKVMTIEEIEKLLDHDKPEGDTILKDLCGIATLKEDPESE